ncbi:hypothetical protein EON65_13725 [archaeon]|nr:MAG: hypothetical protein EON65_13725 [archaeon]
MLLNLLLLLAIAALSCLSERSYIENAIQYNPQGELELLKVVQSATDKKGGSVVGVKFSNALLIAAARRRASSLFELSAQDKVMVFDKGRILVAFSGLLHYKSDVANAIRSFCAHHALVHSSPVPIYKLCHSLGSTMHSMTTNFERIPMGLNMLIAGYDQEQDRFLLYSVHPDGSYQEWKATAIGYNCEKLTSTLSSLMEPRLVAHPAVEEMWPEFVQQVLLSDLMIDKSKPELHNGPTSSEDDQRKPEGLAVQYSREKDFEVYCLAKGAACMEWRQIPWSDILGHVNEP